MLTSFPVASSRRRRSEPVHLSFLLLLALGGVAVEGDEARVLAGEGGGADLFELRLLARGEVDQDGRGRDPLAVFPKRLHLLRAGVDEEGGPLGIRREAGPDGRAGPRRLADGEAVLLGPGRLTEDDLALALDGADLVHEPAPVRGELRRADRLPVQDVLEPDRAGGGGRRGGRRLFGRLVDGLVLCGRGNEAGDEEHGCNGEGEGLRFGHEVCSCLSFFLFS